MKLKYKIEQETTTTPEVLMARIISTLMEQNYLIEDKTIDTVSFKDDAWQIRFSTEIFTRVDSGTFELKASKDGTTIIFTYYVSLLIEFIIAALFPTIGIAINYYFIIVPLPFLIQFLFRIDNLKDETIEIAKRIES